MRKNLIFLKFSLILLALFLMACAPAGGVGDSTTSMDEGGSDAPAASADDERAKTVIFDIDGGRVVDPENWNPFTPGRRLDQGYHQALMEPLFMLNYETGIIEPWLGVSMESNETFDVWTLNLREGLKWADGEDFNADDVVFTITMLQDNAPELAGSSSMAEWVASVEKIDDLTVQFNLTKPNPRFQLDNFSVRIWGSISMVPEHIWADVDPLTFKYYDLEKGWPIFTGPYKLASVGETEFVYTRLDDWWGVEAGFKDRLPHPETLIWGWYGPEESRTAAMANDELDSLMDITLGALLALKQRNPNVVSHFNELPFAWVPDPCSRTFELNHTAEPWGDSDMRWALNYAIDRDEIVNIAYEGSTFKSLHFFPAYPPLDRFVGLLEEAGLYEEYPIGKHDVDLAKEIIESKGYSLNANGIYEKDGTPLTLDITTHDAFIEKQRIAQVVVEQLQRIGIDATHRNEAGSIWGDNFRNGNFEGKMGWQTCGSVNEPWASLDQFNTKWLVASGERANGNAWRWSGENAEAFSAIVDEMGTTPLGDPSIDAMFVEAMTYWMEELPVIPITEARKIIPFNNTYWTNWPTADNPYIHPPTWWQHTHEIIHNLEPAQ